MSYILDSLKKSERERTTVDHLSSVSIHSPAFLDNDKPNRGGLIVLVFIVLASVLMAYFLFTSIKKDEVQQGTAKETIPKAIKKAIPETIKETIQGGIQKTTEETIEETIEETAKPVLTTDNTTATPENHRPQTSTRQQISPTSENARILQAKQEAIALYEQAIQEKSRSNVDSLYNNLSAKTLNTKKTLSTKISTTEHSASQQAPASALVAANSDRNNINQTVAIKKSETKEPETKEPEVLIPSIYDLNRLTKKNIPSINYGAHIYASDKKSGFIILNGARRRIGDRLDNGIYIEKIAEEAVILSYEGTLFSLPAMKSWVGEQ